MVYDANREELYSLKGDAADYAGTGIQGTETSLSLSAAGGTLHPQVRYRDFLIECDVYALPGQPLELVLYCPRCRNALKISQANKRIEFDPHGPNGGRLSVERFKCTWELTPEGRRMEFGLGMCNWQVAIDDNIAKDV